MSAREVAPRLDGLLLTGSPSNVEPARYGQADPDAAGPFDPGRDAMTAGLIEAMTRVEAAGLRRVPGLRGDQCRLWRDPGPRPRRPPRPDGAPLDDVFDHGHEVSLAPAGCWPAPMAATS